MEQEAREALLEDVVNLKNSERALEEQPCTVSSYSENSTATVNLDSLNLNYRGHLNFVSLQEISN